MMSSDFISKSTLDELDPDLNRIIAAEDLRQQQKVFRPNQAEKP